MKSIPVSLFAALICMTLASACATDDPNRRTKTGAAIGALAGGVIGNQSDSKNGKYVGAVVGALTGAAVGNYMDKQQRQLEDRLADERRSQQITVTRIDAETLRLDVRSEASFDVNSSSIQSGFRDSLNTMSEVISEYDQTAVHVIGHTDSTGSQSYNQQLSEKRATEVTRYLTRSGVDRTRMRFSGRGETTPVDVNTTSSGRSRNRRVEIYLKTIVKDRENEAFRAPI